MYYSYSSFGRSPYFRQHITKKNNVDFGIMVLAFSRRRNDPELLFPRSSIRSNVVRLVCRRLSSTQSFRARVRLDHGRFGSTVFAILSNVVVWSAKDFRQRSPFDTCSFGLPKIFYRSELCCWSLRLLFFVLGLFVSVKVLRLRLFAFGEEANFRSEIRRIFGESSTGEEPCALPFILKGESIFVPKRGVFGPNPL